MPTIRTTLLICAAALVTLGCRDESITAPARQLRPGLAARDIYVENPSVQMLSVEISGPGIDDGYLYDVSLVNGRSEQPLAIPAGAERRVVIRGHNQYGEVTHESFVALDKVGEGASDPLKVTLLPVGKGKPVSASLGVVGEPMLEGVRLVIETDAKEILEGDHAAFRATLIDENGKSLELDPRDVHWGVGDPIGGHIDPGTPYADFLARVARGKELFVHATIGGRADDFPVLEVANPFSDIRAGLDHTCAIRWSGSVVCWGSNEWGQLGSAKAVCGTSGSFCANRPTAVNGTWTQIAVGGWHTCGIKSTGTSFCWGGNNIDQLGIGTPPANFNSAVPTAVAGGISFAQLTAGYAHTCGIATSGAGFCWGDNTFSTLGVGPNPMLMSSPTPMAISYSLHWTQLSAGAMSTCGVDEKGKTMCWGASGSVGHAVSGNISLPEETMAPTRTQTLSIGGAGQMCLIDASTHETDCWGPNGRGEVGVGFVSGAPNYSIINPTPLAGPAQTYTMVAAGWNGHTCAVNTSNDVFCWGDNTWSQLGTGAPAITYQPTPAVVVTPLKFSRVAAGFHHTCAITSDGEGIACWGINNLGQLGNATNVNSSTPVMVAP